MHAALRGRVRWQVLDERGMPEVPRNASGLALGPAEGVEQSNLITDLGLDTIAVQSALGDSNLRAHLAVGTGSTAPAATDTALVNEVQRGSGSGGFSPPITTYALDATENVWRSTAPIIRVIEMSADRNLTEFGLSGAASGPGNLNIRELLRDGLGDPVTINLITGKSLRVDHTLYVELPAPVSGIAATLNIDKYDATNTLESSTPYSVVHGGQVATDVSSNVGWVFRAWDPSYADVNFGVKRVVPVTDYARVGMLPVSSGVSANMAQPELVPYTTGTYTRTKRATVGVSTANVEWNGYMFTAAIVGFETGRSGWLVKFVSPSSYTKLDTDTVRVGLVSTWTRA